MQDAQTDAAENPAGFIEHAWYFVCESRALKPGQHMRELLFGEPLVIGRGSDGHAFAFRDICPHRLAPLSAGVQSTHEGNATIACPYHGWEFGLSDGACKLIPALTSDQSMDVSRFQLKKFRVREQEGLVFLQYGDEEPATSLPPPIGLDLPRGPVRLALKTEFGSHIDHVAVGLMDPAHVGFVHNSWWWRPKRVGRHEKQKAVEPIDFGWTLARHAPSSNSPAYRLLGRNVTTEIRFQLPGYRWEIIKGDRGKIVTLTCLTPRADHRTQLVQLTWWEGLPLAGLLKPFLKRFGRRFLAQDQQIVELQAANLPFESRMLWIDDADRQAKWYFTMKKEWSDSRSEGREFVNPVAAAILRWQS